MLTNQFIRYNKWVCNNSMTVAITNLIFAHPGNGFLLFHLLSKHEWHPIESINY